MKKFLLSLAICLTLLFLFPSSLLATSGCCSWHSGVCGCSSGGRQVCCDGTLSPSCTCSAPAPVKRVAPVAVSSTLKAEPKEKIIPIDKNELCKELIDKKSDEFKDALASSEASLSKKQSEHDEAEGMMLINGFYALLLLITSLCFYTIGNKFPEVRADSNWRTTGVIFCIFVFIIIISWLI